jgi:hypothetical protein
MTTLPAPSATSNASTMDWLKRAEREYLGTAPTWEQRLFVLKMANLTPFPEQMPFLQGLDPHGAICKQLLLSGAIQAGKSFVAAMFVLTLLQWSKIVWVVGPRYDDCRFLLSYLRTWLKLLHNYDDKNSSTPNASDTKWIIHTLDGCRIQSFSSGDPESLAGEAPNVIVMEEAGRQTLEAYYTCRSRRVPRDATLLLVGTMEKSQAWYRQMFNKWGAPHKSDGSIAYSLPSWSNREFYPLGYDDPKIQDAKRELPEDVFLARFAGLPPKPEGLVFPDFDTQSHVRPIHLAERPPDADPFGIYLAPDTPLELWMDPGNHHYAILVVAVVNGTIYVVDEVCERLKITPEMVQICQNKPWWGQITKLRSDVAGKQHHANESAAEAWDRLTGMYPIMWRINPDVAADRTHVLLRPDPLTQQPRVVVDPKCRRLIWEFTEGYQHKIGSDGDPLELFRDQDNDAVKAFGYGAVQRFDPVGKAPAAVKKRKRRPGSWERSVA